MVSGNKIRLKGRVFSQTFPTKKEAEAWAAVKESELYRNVWQDSSAAEWTGYTISPILDFAITPEYVNPKYRSHIDYLYKAAEIIRRDPYCSAVEFVEFSPEKSTSENPIVLIMCPQCKNRYPKYYLTLQEIDEQYSKIVDLQI